MYQNNKFKNNKFSNLDDASPVPYPIIGYDSDKSNYMLYQDSQTTVDACDQLFNIGGKKVNMNNQPYYYLDMNNSEQKGTIFCDSKTEQMTFNYNDGTLTSDPCDATSEIDKQYIYFNPKKNGNFDPGFYCNDITSKRTPSLNRSYNCDRGTCIEIKDNTGSYPELTDCLENCKPLIPTCGDNRGDSFYLPADPDFSYYYTTLLPNSTIQIMIDGPQDLCDNGELDGTISTTTARSHRRALSDYNYYYNYNNTYIESHNPAYPLPYETTSSIFNLSPIPSCGNKTITKYKYLTELQNNHVAWISTSSLNNVNPVQSQWKFNVVYDKSDPTSLLGYTITSTTLSVAHSLCFDKTTGIVTAQNGDTLSDNLSNLWGFNYNTTENIVMIVGLVNSDVIGTTPTLTRQYPNLPFWDSPYILRWTEWVWGNNDWSGTTWTTAGVTVAPASQLSIGTFPKDLKSNVAMFACIGEDNPNQIKN